MNDLERAPVAQSAGQAAATARAMSEIEMMMVNARRFPRDEAASVDRMIKACAHKELAAEGLYGYPRGGEYIEGVTIRIAEMMAYEWGNMDHGIRELARGEHVSELEVYAWDLERNVRDSRMYQVRHERHTRSGARTLTDPRDVYEITANYASRRKRAAILAVIPVHIREKVERQVRTTMAAEFGEIDDERIGKLVDGFERIGVSQQMLANRLRHPVTVQAMRQQELLRLQKIYLSVRDGMSKVEDWFQGPPPQRVKEGTDTKSAVHEQAEQARKSGGRGKRKSKSEDPPAQESARAADKDPAPAKDPATEPSDKQVLELANKIKAAKSGDEVDELEDQCREWAPPLRQIIKTTAADKRREFE